jgi:hypothetical protein
VSATAVHLEGKAWQAFADQLLVTHFGPTEYTKFPDTLGDGGIEGFTTCGKAFQAYGAENRKTGRELYEAQRIKMTNDVNKFINNGKLLAKLFGDVKIYRWVLLVPRVGLKELKAHANKLTKKVLAADLPYVADDFIVTYCDEESFATERDKITALKESSILIKGAVPNAAQTGEWEADNRPLADKLDDKLKRLEPDADEHRLARFRQIMLSWHLHGMVLMEKLNDISPTVYEQVFEAKTAYEQVLLQHELTATDPRQQLNEVMNGFRKALARAAKSVHGQTAEYLVCEAVSHWMLRCPLEFRGEPTNV